MKIRAGNLADVLRKFFWGGSYLLSDGAVRILCMDWKYATLPIFGVKSMFSCSVSGLCFILFRSNVFWLVHFFEFVMTFQNLV
jgi:hypothetical protein